MIEPLKLRESLPQAVLDSYREEYKELVDAWKTLEVKAQGAVAIAGIFIAGAFAYVRDVGQAHLYERLSLSLSIFCLMISVVLSIFALKVRTVAATPLGEHIDKLVQDLLQINSDAELLERMPRFVSEQITSWRVARTEAHESNRSKAKYLWAAQVLLTIAILTVAQLSISKLWR
jgi:hypothetical protein